MYPELLRFGDFVISSFGFMLVVAFLTGNYLLKKDMIYLGRDPMLAEDLTFNAAIGGILGGKLYYIIENIPSGYGLQNFNGLINIIKGIFTLNLSLIAAGIQNFGAGMVFYGGLIGGTIAVTMYIRKHNLNWPLVADWIAPYLALCHAIGRIGCLLVGDDYGKQTDLPWGIAFPNGLPPTVVPVHPTQIYEFLAYFISFLYLYKIRHNDNFKGSQISKYLVLVGLSRFFIEFIRVNPKYIFGLSGAQIISLIMVILGSTILYKNSSTK